jgi:hypothetical protein
MECGRGPDDKQAAGIHCRATRRHQDRDLGAVSCVGEGASSSFGSARTSRKESESSDRQYVQAILDCYRRLPGATTVTSRHDRKCARALFRRSVPLDVVLHAMMVAVARRTFRRGDPLPRIRAFHFFLPAVEELLEVPCDPGYVQYLKKKLEASTGQEI